MLTGHRQATQEPVEGVPGYGQDQGRREEGQEISGRGVMVGMESVLCFGWRLAMNVRGVGVGIILVYSYDECLKNSRSGPARWDGV